MYVTLHYSPHIGTLSWSPEIDSINSLTPVNHGGNMDLSQCGRVLGNFVDPKHTVGAGIGNKYLAKP